MTKLGYWLDLYVCVLPPTPARACLQWLHLIVFVWKPRLLAEPLTSAAALVDTHIAGKTQLYFDSTYIESCRLPIFCR
jgi:hypothetical protein